MILGNALGKNSAYGNMVLDHLTITPRESKTEQKNPPPTTKQNMTFLALPIAPFL